MKNIYLLLITLFFLCFTVGSANFSDSPDLVETAATYAKLKAKLNTIHSTVDDVTSVSNHDGASSIDGHIDSSGNCDLNVANVVIADDVRSPPDEVIIVIEGDIIQANNCR